MNLFVYWQIIPPGLQILEQLEGTFGQFFYVMVMLVILAESIVYVGFYFPGQFFAVLMVISAKPDFVDVLYLTIAMVFAATLGSLFNYLIGRSSSKETPHKPTQIKHLLLAMIHMNSLAFFMLSQGANRKPIKVVFLAGVLNLPYYLALIAATAFLSEEVMQVAENTILLYTLLGIWLIIGLRLDFKKRKNPN